jgi:hypothetical protein
MKLIDADEAIREYEACIENYILSGNDSKSRYIEDWEYVIKQLSNKPTAYDVEAVVRELERKSNGFFADDEEFGEMFVKTISLPTAIEIVKEGGRNED